MYKIRCLECVDKPCIEISAELAKFLEDHNFSIEVVEVPTEPYTKVLARYGD